MIPQRQKPINSTIKFITQVGQLYRANGSHKDLALKKLNYFNTWIRKRFLIKNSNNIVENINLLHQNNLISENACNDLLKQIEYIQQEKKISKEALYKLNSTIEDIKKKV